MILAFFTLLLLAGEYFGVFSSRTPKTPKLPPWVWVAVLAASYAVQLGIIRTRRSTSPACPTGASRCRSRSSTIAGSRPRTATGERGDADPRGAPVVRALGALPPAAAAQTLLGGCAVLLLLSLFAPALMSFDMYGYVRGAVLGRRIVYARRRTFSAATITS